LKGSAGSDESICFDPRSAAECGSQIGRLAVDARSMESAASRLVRLLRTTLRDSRTGEPVCALVRCFKTHAYRDLPPSLQAHVRQTAGRDANPAGDLRCLTLLATAGQERQWNDRRLSAGHQAIPLLSVEMVQNAPMIAGLIQQMGLDIEELLEPDLNFPLYADKRTFGAFHVEEALESPQLPAQDFVQKYGIRSVVGFGSLLSPGELVAVILFSKAKLTPEKAQAVSSLALKVKLLFLPFRNRGQIFEPVG
jgi:two-component system NtrC family sensor kinase